MFTELAKKKNIGIWVFCAGFRVLSIFFSFQQTVLKTKEKKIIGQRKNGDCRKYAIICSNYAF